MILIGQVQSRNESIKIPCFSCSIMQQNTTLSPDNHLGMFGYRSQKDLALEEKVKTLENKIEKFEDKIDKLQKAEDKDLSDLVKRIGLVEASRNQVAFRRYFDTLATKEQVETVEAGCDEHAHVLARSIGDMTRQLNGKIDTNSGVIHRRISLLEKNQDKIFQRIQDIEDILQMNRREERGLVKT